MTKGISRSTMTLPRMSMASGGAPTRLLRLQADPRLAQMLVLGSRPSEPAQLLVPTREALERGAEIRVEVSFGPLADEITLRGEVDATVVRGERAPLVTVIIDRDHAARVRYIHEVLSEGRLATARASRRVPTDLRVTWHWGLGSHSTRLSDISKGGAFVRSGAAPSTGSSIGLALDDRSRPTGVGSLELEANVAWAGRSQGQRGFGVRFRVSDRALAGRIAELVRWHERQAGLLD